MMVHCISPNNEIRQQRTTILFPALCVGMEILYAAHGQRELAERGK